MRGYSMKKTTGLMVALLLSVTLAVSACGNNGNNESSPSASESPSASPSESVGASPSEASETPVEKVTLKAVAHASWIKGGMEAVVKDAAEKIGVTLEIEKIAEGLDGDNLLKTRFSTGDVPDLLLYYSAGSELGKLGNPADLFVPQEDQAWFANFDANSWKGSMDYLGKFYGAPYGGAQGGVVFYNKKVFADLGLQPPTTVEQFWEVAEALKAGGKIPLYLAGKDAWTLQLPPMMTGATPDYLDIVAKINLNQAKMADLAGLKKGNELMLELKEKGFINKNFLSDTYDGAEKAVATGEAGMYMMASWMMSDIVAKYPDNVDDLGAFMLPTEDGSPRLPIFAPNAMYVVKGKNQEAAQKFVNYFESIETQDLFFGNEGGIPAIKGVTKTSLTNAELDVKALLDQGGGKPAFAGGLLYGAGDFAVLLQDSLAGGKTPDQVLEAMQKEFEKNAKVQEDPNFK